MSIESKIALAMSADGDSFERVHSNLVKIADDFAIGFLDFAKNKTDYDAWDSKFDYEGVLYSSKELLEMYKKEKGL